MTHEHFCHVLMYHTRTPPPSSTLPSPLVQGISYTVGGADESAGQGRFRTVCHLLPLLLMVFNISRGYIMLANCCGKSVALDLPPPSLFSLALARRALISFQMISHYIFKPQQLWYPTKHNTADDPCPKHVNTSAIMTNNKHDATKKATTGTRTSSSVAHV